MIDLSAENQTYEEYLRQKVSSPKLNLKDVRFFIRRCAQLRQELTCLLNTKSPETPIHVLDQHSCSLCFALIASKWLPTVPIIHSFQDLSTTLIEFFPKSQRTKTGSLSLLSHLTVALDTLRQLSWSKSELHHHFVRFMVMKVHLKEEYFGRAYEEIRKYRAIAVSDTVQFVEAPDRKAHGKYYTPEDVTCLMVAKATEQWMSNKSLKNIHTETRLRVLDPTVGAGAFLLEMVRCLETKFQDYNCDQPQSILQIRHHIIQHNLFGFDIDNEALQVCKLSLWLLSFPHLKPIEIGARLVEMNLLDVNLAKYQPFDIIIGNPPYVKARFGSSAYLKAKSRNLVSLSSKNLYAYVMELSLKLMDGDGILSMIVPLALTNNPKTKSLRKVIQKHHRHTEVLNFDIVPGFIFTQGKIEGTSKQSISQRCSIVTINSKAPFQLETTLRLRWQAKERSVLFEHLSTHPIPKHFDFIKKGIPHIGCTENDDILTALTHCNTTVWDLIQPSPNPEATSLVVFKFVRYFIHADRSKLSRIGLELHPKTTYAHQLLYVYLNSNLFYWYWRTLGQDQGLSAAFVRNAPIVQLPLEMVEIAYNRLVVAEEECSVYKLNAGRRIPNVNFNIRQDLLLQNDLLLLNALQLPPTHVETIFYSKWPSLTQRGLDDSLLERYHPKHHPRRVLPQLQWEV